MTIRDQLQQALGSAYTIDRELGGGGMSRVFLAEDTVLGRKVVLKVLPPELAAVVNVERFNRETLLVAKLQHPHIVPVLTVGSMNGLPWFSMPFVEGESLRTRLDRGETMSIGEVVGVLRDVAKALAYAHERGIVHRDIKPDNVLLTGDSATVADFGIAKAISASRAEGGAEQLTRVGMSIGTPAYMSPEQAASDPDVDHRADIYAFGCLAYEMLTARTPFGNRTPQKQFAAHLTEIPEPVASLRPDTPPAMAALVMQCLEKDVAARPQQARELVRALDATTTRDSAYSVAGGASMFTRALAIWAAALVAIAVITPAAIVGIGLPTWVLPAALLLVALGLPVILWTGYVQRVARQAFVKTPAITPGGTPAYATQGTIARLAVRASPHQTWRRTANLGYVALTGFVAVVGAFMGLRAMGIGPAGSLLASGALAQGERIMMTDFAASGADSALGRVVSDAVRAGLAQSRVVTLLGPTEIRDALRRMERQPNSRITLDIARALSVREGVKAIVDGDVTALGTSYVVAMRLVTADSGRELASYRATASGPEAIITAADALSRKLRARAGESLRAVNAAPPLARVTTSSLDALRRYSEGSRAWDLDVDGLRAAKLLREAVVFDTLFAEGWRKLGAVLTSAGQASFPHEADSALTRAYRLRDRLTEIDRARVTATYFAIGPGADRAKAIAAYEQVLTLGDSSVLGSLASRFESRRQFAYAEPLRRAVARRDSGIASLSALRANLRYQGKWAAADSVQNEAARRYPTNALIGRWAMLSAMLAGDLEGRRRVIDSISGAGDKLDPVQAVNRAMELAQSEGRLRDADSLRNESFRAYRARGIDVGAFSRAFLALDDVANENLPYKTALKSFDDAYANAPPSLKLRSPVALVRTFGKLGLAARARATLAEYERVVTDASVRASNAPEMEDAMVYVAMAERRWTDAAAALRRADRLPDGPANGCEECLPRNLVHLFAAAGMADSALAHYELYRRTPMGSRPRTGPDLQLEPNSVLAVARMYDERGDTVRAVAMYRDYTKRFERADPELQPRVQAAQRRLVELTPVERTRR